MTSFTDWVDEPPAEGTWTNCATLRDQRFFVDLARTNIRLFRDEIPQDSVMRLNLDLEPAPHLDYHLFNVLTCVHWRKIGSSSRELLGCIIDARRDYFSSHEQYRRAFCRLQDVRAYGAILEQEKAQLINSGTANAKQLEGKAIAIQKNDVELAQVYAITVEKSELRERLTTIFCETKELFLKNELRVLVFLGKHLYKRHLEIANSQCRQRNSQRGRTELILHKGSLQNERQPSGPAQESAPSENDQVVPFVTQEIEPANTGAMNHDPERVSPSTVPSGPQLMESGPVSSTQSHPEPIHQNTARYVTIAEQPLDTVQSAQRAPVQQETRPRINEPISPSQAPIQPAQLAPMHRQYTLAPYQAATLSSYQPSQATKQRVPKFLNHGPPAPLPTAPELTTATSVKEAPPPRSLPRSTTFTATMAPTEALKVMPLSSPQYRSIQKAPVAQMQAYPQPFYQPNPAYQATATATLHPNAKYAESLNNKHQFPTYPSFPAASQVPTPHLLETAPSPLTTMQNGRKYALKRPRVYTTPYVQTLTAPAASVQPKQQTEPRPSLALSPTISYSRVPVKQKIKTPKPVALAGEFLSRLLEQEMGEDELAEIAARLGPAERIVDQEASDERNCVDEA